MIKQIKPADTREVYNIWKSGTDQIMRDNKDALKGNEPFYEHLLAQRIVEQNDNFKLWGFFEKDELIGWISLLPCRPTPLLYNFYAEVSLYIRPDHFHSGIGSELVKHAIGEARKDSSLCYISAVIPSNHESVTRIVEKHSFKNMGVIPKSSKDKTLSGCVYWILPL